MGVQVERIVERNYILLTGILIGYLYLIAMYGPVLQLLQHIKNRRYLHGVRPA